MALIKLTAFMDSISGKVNGSVFSRNKGGAYVRSRGVVSNPKSIAQSAVRAVFGAISQAWKGLTQVQRDAWNAATSNFPYQNRLGDTKLLSGFALHQKLNNNLATLNRPFIANPPQPQEVSAFETIGVDIDTSGADPVMFLEGTFTDPSSTSGSVVVFATPSLSPGVSNFSNDLRLLGNYPIATVVAKTDIFTDYEAIYGTVTEGSKVGFKAYVIDRTTGQATAEIKTSAIAHS